jgi:hypothetical protein
MVAFGSRVPLATLGALAFACAGWGQIAGTASPSSALQITTAILPTAVAHQAYKVQLLARGGTPPYRWNVEKGELPPGLHLQSETGIISGQAEQSGKPQVTVQVRDSANPPKSAVREYTLNAVPPLDMVWVHPPKLQEDGIYGEVKVSNPSEDTYDVTFIVVAINEINKAFALGYQHFTLPAGKAQEISFGSSLSLGDYSVHADAVAEIASKNLVRRAQLQTPRSLLKR